MAKLLKVFLTDISNKKYNIHKVKGTDKFRAFLIDK